MGKGKSTNPKRKSDDTKIGCNCPIGCELNEPMSDPAPKDCVPMECSNDKCNANQNLHKQCFDNFEITLIRTIQSSMGRTRDWTDDQCRRSMWSRVYDLIYRNCKCVCGGHLRRVEVAAADSVVATNSSIAAEEGRCSSSVGVENYSTTGGRDLKSKKRKNKAGRNELPKLVLDKTKTIGAGGSSLPEPYAKPKDRFRESDQTCDNYIPGLTSAANSTAIPSINQKLAEADVRPKRLNDGEATTSHFYGVGKDATFPLCDDELSVISSHSNFDCREAFAYWRHEFLTRTLIEFFDRDKKARANESRLLRGLLSVEL